jgi:hypothetical protein
VREESTVLDADDTSNSDASPDSGPEHAPAEPGHVKMCAKKASA